MFEKSQSIAEIAKALVEFHKEVPAIKKSEENPFFKSSYASLSGIIETVEPHLTKNGLSFVQFPIAENELITILMHTSGEWMQGSYKMTPSKNDPQGTGSAITYQKRYALAAVLGLKLEDDDDDANAASGKGKKGSAIKETETQLFDKACKMIDSCQNAESLKEWKANIAKSKIYTQAHQHQLLKKIDEQMIKVGETKPQQKPQNA